jgi:rhodanese-related sulfurtransferase
MDAKNQLQDISPAEVRDMLAARSIVLIDVREPEEFMAGRIAGALLFPLSTFDPTALPPPSACKVVFHCGSGKRSAMAVARCQELGVAHHAHMTGGLGAWKAAGLPVV